MSECKKVCISLDKKQVVEINKMIDLYKFKTGKTLSFSRVVRRAIVEFISEKD